MKSSITYYTPAKHHHNGVWSYNIESKITEPSFIPEVGDTIKFGGERGKQDWALVYSKDVTVCDGNTIIDIYCERIVGKYDRRPRTWFLDKVDNEDQDILMEAMAMSEDYKAKEIREIETDLVMDGERVES